MCAQDFCFQEWMLVPIVICIIIMFVRGFSKNNMPFGIANNSSNTNADDDSVKNKTNEILKVRLAKGEICIEEYEKMKDILV